MSSKYIFTPGSLLYIYVQCIINIPLCKSAHVKYWMTYLKTTHQRDPRNGFTLYLWSIYIWQTIIKIANQSFYVFLSLYVLLNIHWDLSTSVLFFIWYTYIFSCAYKNLWLTPQRIIKEHLPRIIKEKEYRDIKMHAFQWKSIKNDWYKFLSIISVK